MKYIKALDSLRALAVFVVVFHHLPVLPFETPFTSIFDGVTGVDIFFVLSGFLITGILLSAKTGPGNLPVILRSFYVRRFLRIFPVYYATILFLMLLNPHNYRNDAVYDLLYISNFYMGIKGDFTSVTPHFWSLSVEEQFYLFWPLLVLLVPRKFEWHSFLLVALLGLASFFITRYTGHAFYGMRTFNNLFYLAAGGVWAYCFFHVSSTTKNKWSLFAGIYIVVFILTGIIRYFFHFTFQPVLHYFVCFLFAFALVVRFSLAFKGFMQKIAENRVAVYLGRISYGIYIFHFIMIFPLVAILKNTCPALLDNLYWSNVLKIVLCIIVSAGSWYFIEKPLLGLKKKFTYK